MVKKVHKKDEILIVHNPEVLQKQEPKKRKAKAKKSVSLNIVVKPVAVPEVKKKVRAKRTVKAQPVAVAEVKKKKVVKKKTVKAQPVAVVEVKKKKHVPERRLEIRAELNAKLQRQRLMRVDLIRQIRKNRHMGLNGVLRLKLQLVHDNIKTLHSKIYIPKNREHKAIVDKQHDAELSNMLEGTPESKLRGNINASKLDETEIAKLTEENKSLNGITPLSIISGEQPIPINDIAREEPVNYEEDTDLNPVEEAPSTGYMNESDFFDVN